MIQVEVNDTVGYKIERLARDFPAINNFMISAISVDFADYIRKKKLSGQALAERTGELKESVRFYKLKNGIFGVRPGAGVRGRLNYVVGFERGFRSGPLQGIRIQFMAPAAQEYAHGTQVQKIANDTIESAYRIRGIK